MFAKLPVEEIWRGDADSEIESDDMEEDFHLLRLVHTVLGLIKSFTCH